MPTPTVIETNLPGLTRRGKVRDIYTLPDAIMLVATDRISAFDVVFDEPIPGKGVVLTQTSRFWMETLSACQPHHLRYVVSRAKTPDGYEAGSEQLVERAMVCEPTTPLPVECVVRGYLVGGGWREYQQTGAVSGIELDPGLRLAEQLDEPLFTPSTKADAGHDEPITFAQTCSLVGQELMFAARARSLAIYREAAAHARERGVIIADTKFEFGLRDGELLLIDEVLTPDSSRFWPADAWRAGENPPSYDKQLVRDYLETLDWNKQPPAPTLPADIIENTRRRYLEIYERLTGAALTKP